MICQKNISTYISGLAVSLLLLFASAPVSRAQSRLFSIEKDSVPLFNGFALSFDLVGPVMQAMGDYGDYEAALRINLHDQYFPIFEIGYGRADRDDEVTGIRYKTGAPFFRIGCDLNLLRNKHAPNRLYGGVRYAFTTYNVDISRSGMTDPVWGGDASFAIDGDACNQHWMEVVFGLDAKVWGPIHMGWIFRYKRRIAHKDSSIGNTWYVPGYGIYGDTRLGATFNVIVDI
ncbi:MAG: hypothetical protein K2L56_06575 [Prevotella sp.]|nr:hypothetical protein [Prevotella sp.]